MMRDAREHACLHCVRTRLWTCSCVFAGVEAGPCGRTPLRPVTGALHTSAGVRSRRGPAGAQKGLTRRPTRCPDASREGGNLLKHRLRAPIKREVTENSWPA